MTFREYPEPDQARLTTAIRAAAGEHQATALYLWRTALEIVNPEVLPMKPHCPESSLRDVYAMLDVAGMA